VVVDVLEDRSSVATIACHTTVAVDENLARYTNVKTRLGLQVGMLKSHSQSYGCT
jgi:hypothetical protein